VISRVAENVYWLGRYVERAESTARLLRTATGLLADMPEVSRWTPVLVVCGEQARFVERFGEAAQEDGDLVLRYLALDPECPVSVVTSVVGARENARTTRDTVSREVWEATNRLHLWLQSDDARRAFDDDLQGFFGRVTSFGDELRGAAEGTMLRDEPLFFLQLGVALERAGQTARALDVKHHMLGPTVSDVADTSADTVAWLATLLSCAAYEAYFKRNRGSIRGRRVARLLVLDEAFPRSVRAALDDALAALERLHDPSRPLHVHPSGRLLAGLRDRLVGLDVNALVASGIHEELTVVVDGVAAVGAALYADLFDPPIRPVADTGGAEA
jgi:uncharacterized alpha-E superfamily protein